MELGLDYCRGSATLLIPALLVTVLLGDRHVSRCAWCAQGEYCSVTVKGKSVGILRPITFMNNSGMSVRKVRGHKEPAELASCSRKEKKRKWLRETALETKEIVPTLVAWI